VEKSFGKNALLRLRKGTDQGLEHAAVEMLSNGQQPAVEIVGGAVVYRWHGWKHTEAGSAVVKGTLWH
jgi:hypothetical protein